MTIGHYYNEWNAYRAEWLRNLIRDGHLPEGDVDERDVRDIEADDLAGYAQCHFFAGIGGWAEALRLAGWPDDRPIWTGSCPCQPFSTAGKRKGFEDTRHLWPDWFRLIAERQPATVFGEQVASGDGLVWLDAVAADLEGMGYAVRAADLCAAGVGAPHERQRLWFRADAYGNQSGAARREPDTGSDGRRYPGRGRPVRGADADERQARASKGTGPARLEHASDHRGLCSADAESAGTVPAEQPGQLRGTEQAGLGPHAENGDGRGATEARRSTFWSDCEWLPARIGDREVAIPAEPGVFPLVDGFPGRVEQVSAYGDAIVPQVAAAFVRVTEEGVTMAGYRRETT